MKAAVGALAEKLESAAQMVAGAEEEVVYHSFYAMLYELSVR